MTHPNESFDTLDTDSIDYEESFIDMKYTHCGYEEKMPECHKDTLFRKPTVSLLI